MLLMYYANPQVHHGRRRQRDDETFDSTSLPLFSNNINGDYYDVIHIGNPPTLFGLALSEYYQLRRTCKRQQLAR